MSLVSEPTASLEAALAHASRLLETDPDMAGEQAREILRVVDKHPVALLLLAASHSAKGEFAQAAEILGDLCRSQPHSAKAHLDLAVALGRIGRNQDAVTALRHAVKLKPELPRIWLALGEALWAAGDPEGADASFVNHIRYSSHDRSLLEAASALHEERIPEAETLLRAHLKSAPTDVAAIRMLAQIAIRIGRHEDAQHLLERCLELAPSFREARQNYALVLQRDNKPAQALAELDILLAHDPGNPAYRILKAASLCRVGEYETAIGIYQEVLDGYPGNARIWLSFGHALKTAGHQDRAIHAYRKSIELDPGFGEAYWSMANLKTFRFDDHELAQMREQLGRADLPVEHRLHFEFALGKALEDAAQYLESFQHYEVGNALRLGTVPYNAKETTARSIRAMQVYDREFFDSRQGFGTPAPDPIFIVGLPRSGSTLIEQILSSHSAVEGTMELPEVIAMTRALRLAAQPGTAVGYHQALATLDADELRRLGEQYLERTRVQRKSGAPLFIDKMPNNFAHIGLIHLMLPNAKIIDARRHPLACCLSGFKQHFAQGQNFSYSFADIGRYYRDYVALMAHFDQVLPGRVHRVIYETMVDDTEAEVRRLLDYCGLPFEAQCLRFFENDRPVRTASSEQVRQPIYREGIDHWRNYEPWLGPLKAALGPVLDAYPAPPEF
jgi:cytochrome c-type biogenesis protein CcmH/NrfG